MEWFWYILLILLQLVGLLLNILGLPGLWLMVGATGVFAWITYDDGFVHWGTLVALLLLAVAAEVVEFIAGSAGAKKAGGSKSGAVGAIVGGFVGGILGTAIPIPVVGTIIGACIGSFLGSGGIEWYNRGDVGHATRVGWGAAKGRFLGILGKTAFGLVILLVTLIAAFPIGGDTEGVTQIYTAPDAVEPTTQPATRPTTLPANWVPFRSTTQPAPVKWF